MSLIVIKIIMRLGLLFSLFFCGQLFAQTTITLQPDATDGKDAIIWYIVNQNGANGATNSTNYGARWGIKAQEWTYIGDPGSKRSLFEFDLSTIPEGVVIIDAKLSLYNFSESTDGGHSTLSGSNECLIQRVIETWDADIVTWNNQPSITTENQVLLEASESFDEDYLDIEITDLIQDSYNHPDSSFGFLFSMNTSALYRAMIFASSDHSDALRHPKLEITYQDPCIEVITIYDTVTVYQIDTLIVYDTLTVYQIDTLTVYNYITVTDTLLIDVNLTDVNQVELINTIKVYPNPTNDIVTINTGDYAIMESYSIKIINNLGEVIFESLCNQQIFQVDISSFGANGLYFIQIIDDAGQVIDTRKIVLQ